MTTPSDELTPAALDALRAQLERNLPSLEQMRHVRNSIDLIALRENTIYTLALLLLDIERRLRALEATRRDEEGGR